MTRVTASQEEMDSAKLPLHWRDFCSHLLIPLNKCRRDNFYMPWACHHERHAYEKCQYKDWIERVQAMDRIRAAEKGVPEAGAPAFAPSPDYRSRHLPPGPLCTSASFVMSRYLET